MSTGLTAEGRAAVNHFRRMQAQAYGGEVGEQFTVTPSIAQILQELLVLDAGWFLQKVNIVGVPQIQGQKVLMLQSGLVSGRIDTTVPGNERIPMQYSSLNNKDYQLYQVNTDVALLYAWIDAWAKFPNFAEMWNGVVRKAIGNDRLRVGWVGESAAASTDPVANPHGEDILPGWLAQIRAYNGGSQYTAGTTVSGTTTTNNVVLSSTEFPNLDYLVSVTREQLDPVYQEDPNMVALISRDLINYEEAQIFKASGRTPWQKEVLLSDEGRLTRNFGGLQSYMPPFIPNGTVLITPFANLSIYYQDTSWRRLVRDWAPKNQYQDFNSRNEGYVVEDFRATALVDGITVAPAA